jgi:putative transposase
MGNPKHINPFVGSRDLIHFTPNDAPYFVTFCLYGLYDRELALVKEKKMKFAAYDKLLDNSIEGPLHLKDPRCAQIVYDKLLWLSEEVLGMHAFTIMSNHVHLMLSLKEEQSLGELLRLVKGSTARECNKILGLTGQTFWQSERYDRVIRWKEHRVTFEYLVNNATKAGIVKHWREHPWTWVNERTHYSK